MDDNGLRLALFLGALLLLMCVEQLGSRSLIRRFRSICTNLSLAAISTFILRALFFISAIAVAHWCAENQWGLSYWLDLPMWLACLLSFLILDAGVYWQHRAFHETPLLWKLHQVHHSDLGVDVSTGVRFHPIEITLSQLWKMFIVVFVGAPVAALIIFELTLSLCSLFIHTNVVLPWRVEQLFGRVFVTPAIHRVHHNRELPDTDRNYSTIFSVWDSVFGSYRAPRGGETINFGLHQYPESVSLWRLLLMPFKR